MPDFIPGIQLNEAYFREAVQPILQAHFPSLAYSAGLIGYGSDVLGFDTAVSTDHQWGPRLVLFLPPESFDQQVSSIDQALRTNLPYQFRGYSTSFSAPDLADGGTRVAQENNQGPVDHLISFYTIKSFWQQELGVDPFETLAAVDWLTFQEHRLLTLTAGKLFLDMLGIEQVRQKISYYPQDVWLYLLAAQWSLISQEEAFVGRTQQVGDELGSLVITARLVERIMRLCFLMEKKYTPYSKWIGTAFQKLSCYSRMGPVLNALLNARTYPERENYLSQAYVLAAKMHNDLAITEPVEARTRTYSGWHSLRAGEEILNMDDPRDTRPHQVIFGGRFCDAIMKEIKDVSVLAFPPIFGSVNQFLVESSDALQSITFCRGMRDILGSS